MDKKEKERKLKELKDIIDSYGPNNAKFNEYKKVCGEENGNIKALMTELELDNCQTSEWKATKKIIDKEVINEDKLIEIARKYNIDIIRQKEYIDYDKLEEFTYAGSISKEMLLEIDTCRQSKPEVRLTVSKIKKKEE